MKIVLAPDKFKGSLSAREVCDAIKEGIKEVVPHANVTNIPMADGGEGTLDMLVESLNLERVKLTVQDPLFRNIESEYAIKGKDAYIEMALASGLQLLTQAERNAMNTSSIGVGQLMKDALEKGAENIYLFVGGSATNDGGIGMASALGYRFLDESGNEVVPIGANLGSIRDIEIPDEAPNFNLVLVTDVKNTLLGTNGATFQYGPQKGVESNKLHVLEDGMVYFSTLVKAMFNKHVSELAGSGAAGGMALCGVGLFGGSIKSGIDLLLELANFKEEVKDANLVITGEGKMDIQTLEGKVVFGVAKVATGLGKKVIAICGDSELSSDGLKKLKLREALKLKTGDLSIEYCLENASKLIKERMINYLRSNKIVE